MFDTLEKQGVFKANSIEDITQSLADYLPSDKYFLCKNRPDSNLRKLLASFANEIRNAENIFELLADNMNPWFTYELLEEWERFLGIPDTCFKVTAETSIDTRRRYIIAKLSLMEVQTADDWVKLAAFLGYEIEIVYPEGQGEFPYDFPFFFFDNETGAYTMYVKVNERHEEIDAFPLPFPSIFGIQDLGFLNCLFHRIKPAYVNVFILPEDFFIPRKRLLEDDDFRITEDNRFRILEQ